MGLGKTTCSLAAHKVLRRERMISKTLVIAPLRPVYEVWPKEIEKWMDFRRIPYAILHGSKKEQALREDAEIFFINPEGVPWLAQRFGYENVKGKQWKKRRRPRPEEWPFDMLVVDESTQYKHTNTLRFHLLRGILGEFKRRVILTGTPAPNGLLDLFGQIYILDAGASLGQYITHYRQRFFYPSGFGGFDWKLREGGEREIYEAIGPLVHRVDAQDELDLPDLVTTDVFVELPPAARAVYDELETDFLTRVSEGRVIAANAAVASTKCRQVANGGVYTDDKTMQHLHEEKTSAVLELVDELQGKPALVAYDTHHDLERLRRAFPSAPWIGGGVKMRDTSRAIADWNAGLLPVLLVQPDSAAHGLNLQESGNVLIWHSLTWNLEHYDQLIRRLLRQGQRAKRVMNYRIVARNTLDDQAIIPALNRKDRTQQGLLDALRDIAKRRAR